MFTVRRIESRDEQRWRELWAGYNRFYERELPENVTARTWRNIMDAAAPVHAIVAGNEHGAIVGIANYLIHESTSTPSAVCYLQDLFVDPEVRGSGAGRLMIDWLVAEMTAQGWSRLYWHTKENNYRARGLYDKYTPHSGFIRYAIANPVKLS